jgi:uncharacterized protein (DUF4415 family)
MAKTNISAIDDSWDDETFGEVDEGALTVATKDVAERLDVASGTQLVSIRMQKSMIDAFKAIAANNNDIGYQTLMKQILQRFIDSEMKRIWREHLAELEATAKEKQQDKARAKDRHKKAA